MDLLSSKNGDLPIVSCGFLLKGQEDSVRVKNTEMCSKNLKLSSQRKQKILHLVHLLDILSWIGWQIAWGFV